MSEQIKLIITEEDLNEDDRGWVEEELNKVSTLGEEDARKKPIFDIIPKLIARRISNMTCAGFKVTEISLEIGVAGKLFGTGIDGKANIKMTRE